MNFVCFMSYPSIGRHSPTHGINFTIHLFFAAVLVLAPLLSCMLVLLSNPPAELPPQVLSQVSQLRAQLPLLGAAQAFTEVLALCLLFGRLFTCVLIMNKTCVTTTGPTTLFVGPTAVSWH